MEKKQKTKYHKETDTIINLCEIKIDKPTKTVKYSHVELKVIISNDRQYVVENYGTFSVLEKLSKNRYDVGRMINKIHVGEQRWNMRGLDDYLFCRCYSTSSEKVTKNRIRRALINFIKKEAYFYTGLEHEIDQQLSESKVTGHS